MSSELPDMLAIFRSMPEYAQAKIMFYCQFLSQYPEIAALAAYEELQKKEGEEGGKKEKRQGFVNGV